MTHVFFYTPISDMVLGLSGCPPNNKLPTGQLQLSQDKICNLSETLDNMIQIPSLKDENSLAVLKTKFIRPRPNQAILLEVSDFRKKFRTDGMVITRGILRCHKARAVYTLMEERMLRARVPGHIRIHKRPRDPDSAAESRLSSPKSASDLG